jgi:hypothetical protein
MRTMLALLLGAGLLSGCGSTVGGIPIPRGPSGDVIVLDDDRDRDRDERRGGGGARTLGVPRGHYPPPGECRVWYPGREPGQQPPPARCERLVGRVPLGAFILYNGKEWDTRYDWPEHERRNRGSVPRAILDVMRSLSR